MPLRATTAAVVTVAISQCRPVPQGLAACAPAGVVLAARAGPEAAGKGVEGEGQVAGRLKALVRMLLQAAPHDPLEVGGRLLSVRESSGGSSFRIAFMRLDRRVPWNARFPESIS